MTNLFLKLLNMSITAGWMIIAVTLLRILLKKAPRWMICLLWALVAVRLVCPFSLESIFSLVPSREVLPRESVVSATPSVNSGITFVDNMVNPMIQNTFRPDAGVNVSPMLDWISIAAAVWLLGAGLLLLHAFVSCLRLYNKIRTAVRLRDNIYLSEFVDTPFIFGLIRPQIYLPSHMSRIL